jgi:hypothetical protein
VANGVSTMADPTNPNSTTISSFQGSCLESSSTGVNSVGRACTCRTVVLPYTPDSNSGSSRVVCSVDYTASTATTQVATVAGTYTWVFVPPDGNV